MTFATGLSVYVWAPLKWLLHLFGITVLVVLLFLTPPLAHSPKIFTGAVLIITYAASIAMQVSGSEELHARKWWVVVALSGSVAVSFVILSIVHQSPASWNMTLTYIALALWSLALYIIDSILYRKTVEEFKQHIAELHVQNS